MPEDDLQTRLRGLEVLNAFREREDLAISTWRAVSASPKAPYTA